jgi:hypothetical protein
MNPSARLFVPVIDAHSLAHVSSKYNTVNLVYNSTKMAKAIDVFYKMVWKARKDGQCSTRMPNRLWTN